MCSFHCEDRSYVNSPATVDRTTTDDNMQRNFVLLGCLLALSSCLAVEFEDCGSVVGKFTTVTLSGCDLSKPACNLVRNTNASLTIEFTTEKDVSQVTAVVHGIIMDMPVPFPLPMANACEAKDSGITCPLATGGPYRYTVTIPVYKAYPKLSVTVKFELRNEKNENIVCVLFPTKITD